MLLVHDSWRPTYDDIEWCIGFIKLFMITILYESIEEVHKTSRFAFIDFDSNTFFFNFMQAHTIVLE